MFKNTIYLKKTIRRSCRRNIPLRRLNLEGVKIVAKSQFNMGRAKLRVGEFLSRSHRIGREMRRRPGRPGRGHGRGMDINIGHSSYRNSYNRLFIENPSYYGSSHGPWQIKLFGHIKVRKVVLFLNETYDDYGDYNDRGRGGIIFENDPPEEDEPIGEDRSD